MYSTSFVREYWSEIRLPGTGDHQHSGPQSFSVRDQLDSENIFTNWSSANDRKWVVWFMHRSQRPLTIYIDWWMRLYCSIIIWQEGQSMKIVRCFSHLKICTKGLTRILLGAFTLLSGTEYLVHWSGSSSFHTCQFGLDFSGKLRSPD